MTALEELLGEFFIIILNYAVCILEIALVMCLMPICKAYAHKLPS